MIREVHFATVINNVDPAKRGGIRVRCDTLLDGADLLDGYVQPSFPYAGKDQGWFFVPDVGAQVEIEVYSGDAALDDLGARYRSVLYSDLDAAPKEFTKDPAKRAGIKYGKHVLIFDKAADFVALVSSRILFGSEDADQPFILGTVNNDFLRRFLTNYASHTHTGMGFAPSPQAIAFQTAEDPQLELQLSTKIFGE